MTIEGESSLYKYLPGGDDRLSVYENFPSPMNSYCFQNSQVSAEKSNNKKLQTFDKYTFTLLSNTLHVVCDTVPGLYGKNLSPLHLASLSLISASLDSFSVW
jgi:hypothetical protein